MHISRSQALHHRDANLSLAGEGEHREGTNCIVLQLVQYYFDQLKRNQHESCDEQCHTEVVDYPLENKSGGRGIRVVNTMRKWCCRFKKRWQVRHGQMMEREFMPPAELRDKARTNNTFLGSSFNFF